MSSLLLIFCILLLGVQSQKESGEDSFLACVSTCDDEEITIDPAVCEGVFKEACFENGKMRVIDCLGNFSSSFFQQHGDTFLRNKCKNFAQNSQEYVDEESGDVKKDLITCTGVYEWTNDISNGEMEFDFKSENCSGVYQYTSDSDVSPRLSIGNIGTIILNTENDDPDDNSPYDSCSYYCDDKPLYGQQQCMGEYNWVCTDEGRITFSCSGVYAGGWKAQACFGPISLFESYTDYEQSTTCSNAWAYLASEDGVEQWVCEGVFSSQIA